MNACADLQGFSVLPGEEVAWAFVLLFCHCIALMNRRTAYVNLSPTNWLVDNHRFDLQVASFQMSLCCAEVQGIC